MIAVTDIDINGDKARVSLFADAKTDVSADAVEDLVGREIEMGSSCVTADGDIGFFKSDGTWNWVE